MVEWLKTELGGQSVGGKAYLAEPSSCSKGLTARSSTLRLSCRPMMHDSDQRLLYRSIFSAFFLPSSLQSLSQLLRRDNCASAATVTGVSTAALQPPAITSQRGSLAYPPLHTLRTVDDQRTIDTGRR